MSRDLPALREGGPLRRFSRGLRYPLGGLRLLLRSPDLWVWVILPVTITTSLLAMALWASWTWTPALLAWLWPVPVGAGVAVVLLWHVVAAMLALTVFSFSAVALYFGSGLVAVPFNDKLSEQVEVAVNGPRPEPFRWRTVLGDLALSVAHSTVALALWLAVMAVLLVLGLFPGVGSALGFVLGTLATAFFLARETMDGAMSRRRMGFGRKLRVVAHNLPVMLGFGLGVSLMLWIPLLNFVCLPVAVVGGTLLFLDAERQGLVPE